MKNFKPMLAPNKEPNLDEIKYPVLASFKLDGIRCIFKDGEILSRSLKPIQNKQLREKFEPIRKYCGENNIILDGEIYSHYLTFQEITSFVMTNDLKDPKTIKKLGGVINLPSDLNFYCFDNIKTENLEEVFHSRIYNITHLPNKYEGFINTMVIVNQITIHNKKELMEHFEVALENGYEGLILKDPNGRYKCGRGTLKEGLIYKLKPYTTFDTKILDVVQATAVNENADKTINELGRSVTSKKKDDRHLINKASAFLVKYEGKDLKVTLSITDEEKEEVWINKESYINRWIEYKGMLVGAKDVPRHPVMIRFREDKDN